eukprot:scaffold220_cov169-Amphora_coffeaeformis.AAC.16
MAMAVSLACRARPTICKVSSCASTRVCRLVLRALADRKVPSATTPAAAIKVPFTMANPPPAATVGSR